MITDILFTAAQFVSDYWFLVISILMFVVLYIWRVTRRRRRTIALQNVFGESLSPDKSYIGGNLAILISPDRQRFAVATPKSTVICDENNILDVSIVPGFNTQFGGQSFRLETTNPSLPMVRIDTMIPSRRLEMIAGHLKAMQAEAATKAKSPNFKEVNAEGQLSALERAMVMLAQAVMTLATELKASRLPEVSASDSEIAADRSSSQPISPKADGA